MDFFLLNLGTVCRYCSYKKLEFLWKFEIFMEFFGQIWISGVPLVENKMNECADLHIRNIFFLFYPELPQWTCCLFTLNWKLMRTFEYNYTISIFRKQCSQMLCNLIGNRLGVIHSLNCDTYNNNNISFSIPLNQSI